MEEFGVSPFMLLKQTEEVIVIRWLKSLVNFQKEEGLEERMSSVLLI